MAEQFGLDDDFYRLDPREFRDRLDKRFRIQESLPLGEPRVAVSAAVRDLVCHLGEMVPTKL